MLGNKYVAGVVGIILVIVIAYNVQFFMTKNNKTPLSPEDMQQQKVSEAARQHVKPQQLPAARPSEGQEKGSWKRDPFSVKAIKETRTAEAADDIRLMGIVKRDGRSHALINGKVYAVNDRIGNAVIREIKQHSIVLLTGADGRPGREAGLLELSIDDYNVIKEKKK